MLPTVRGRTVLQAVLAGVCVALAASGCGSARQDVHEAKRTFTMEIVKASFPAKQSIARTTALELQVRNASSQTAPSVAVSVDSFNYRENYPQLAASQRPVWVIEHGPGPAIRIPVESQAVTPPGGAQTSYVNTWTRGPLAAGATQTFLWRVTPVKAGTHTVRFTIAAGLAGKARARTAAGGAVQGQLTADVAPSPPARHVDPRTGRVVSGAFPIIP
jgi:hypothetical protein